MKTHQTNDLPNAGRWQNVRAFYEYTGTPERAQMVLNLELDSAAYQPLSGLPAPAETAADVPAWQQHAARDQQSFNDIHLQLNQTFDKTDLPEAAAAAVSMFLTNNLLKSKKISLPAKDAQSVRDFVARCLEYVTDRAAGFERGISPVCQLQVPLETKNIGDFGLIKPALALSFEIVKPDELPSPDGYLRRLKHSRTAVSGICNFNVEARH